MSECIEWSKGRDIDGYGSTWYNGKTVKAHRLSYCKANNLELDDIKGLIVRHTCDNPPCINPDHLIIGTHTDNMTDRGERNRQAKGVDCIQSKLTPEIVKECRSRYKRYCKVNGFSALAREFGVSPTVMEKAVKGEQWSHV